MKLSEWAKKKGVSYKTAWRWFKKGIIVEENEKRKNGNRCIIYTRVSDRQSKDNLRETSRKTQRICYLKRLSNNQNSRENRLGSER